MIKKLKTLTLKKIGRSFMLVETDGTELNMTNVYNMNSTSAWLWNHLDAPCDGVGEMAEAMCGEFDVDRATAEADITRQLAQWRELGLIE